MIIGSALEQKLTSLLGERAEIEKELATYETEKSSSLSFKEVLPLLNEFDEMPLDIKHNIAVQFIQQIKVYDDRIEVLWKI